MAKTIKEMLQESAYRAYPEELDNETEHNVSMRVGYKIGYEAGANAVLEEIIGCFPETLFCNPNEVIGKIASKIKELKG